MKRGEKLDFCDWICGFQASSNIDERQLYPGKDTDAEYYRNCTHLERFSLED